jgi:pilus assembly protein CpaF
LAAKKFYLDEYIEKTNSTKKNNHKVIDITKKDKKTRFNELCSAIYTYFQNEWESEGSDGAKYTILLERQKKAIIGYEKEVNFFKDKINEYLKKNNLYNEWHPSWYKNITEAIYEENWGLAGVAQWKYMTESSSAKIIGNRIYFLIDGKQVLQKQTICEERLKQLISALLLKEPKIRLDNNFAEVYMLDGTRITIFTEGLTKKGQPAIIFRKYIIPKLTFEEQAKRHTIPYEIIPMLKDMVKIGYNVAFTGPVRTAKTTFLQTWQLEEDPTLEGVMIETDPEIPLHELMPDAPIIQIVADDKQLEGVIKRVLRSDADYIVMAEARDATAFYIALDVTDRGTRRSKLTAHFTRAVDFPYNVADKIVNKYGGSLYSTIIKVAQNFHYIFEFIQLRNKSQKRLKAIYEIRYDFLTQKISLHQICKYIFKTDSWSFKCDIGKDKLSIADEEDIEAGKRFKEKLKELEEKYPYEGENIFVPSYKHLRG